MYDTLKRLNCKHLNKNNLTQGIYDYFVNCVSHSQLIIIENEKDIPTINLNNPKIKYYILLMMKMKEDIDS